VVVAINAWLYILSAAAVALTFFANETLGDYVAGVLGILWSLAIGVGLLRRRNWARWLAIGPSLLTWTLGPLLLVWIFFHAYRSSGGFHRVPIGYGVFFAIAAAFCIWVLWLSYRLFKHLISSEGRGQFRTPESERNVVVKSTAAYIAYLVIVGLLSPYDLSALLGKRVGQAEFPGAGDHAPGPIAWKTNA